MEILNLVIGIVALIIAVTAFKRTGRTKDLKKTQPSFWPRWKKGCGKKKSQ